MGMGAGMGAATALYGVSVNRPELAGTLVTAHPLEGMTQAARRSRLQDWEANSQTQRLLAMRRAMLPSHCTGCGAPLALTSEGVCEYCGLKPKGS